MSESQPDADANFIVNMKAARESNGWTQAYFAQILTKLGAELNQSAISRVEAGEREVRLAEARAIAQAFSTTVDAMSASPASFAKVREWNRILATMRGALEELQASARDYEDARHALAQYMEKPQVALRRSVEDEVRDLIATTSIEAVGLALNDYQPTELMTFIPGDEPPF